MKRELAYFKVENLHGGSQAWFADPLMRFGGCAAVAACESCICLDLRYGTALYPYEKAEIGRTDYLSFGLRMKPYLHPRLFGINRLETYIAGFGKYLADRDCHAIRMEALHGGREAAEAKEAVKRQIGRELPVPCLLLKHRDPTFRNYVWHWFLLTGYEEAGGRFMVKAVTYGNWRWLDLDKLWDTGCRRRGGLIQYEVCSV